MDLEGFGGQRVKYLFSYWNKLIDRSCKDTDPSTGRRISVPQLTKITLPDGTTYKFDKNGLPAYQNTCFGGIEDAPGFLTRVELPTLGSYEWEIQEYSFPPGEGNDPFNTNAGVLKKIVKDKAGQVVGEWRYKSTTVGKNDSGTGDPEKHTEVVTPTGECSKHFFNARYWLTPSQGKGWEYGLNFVRSEESNGKYLSSQVWTSSTAGGSCTGTKLRSTYADYRHDKLPGSNTPSDQWFNSNRAPKSSRTVFHDDGDKYIETEMSDDDGLGHFRQTVTRSNFVTTSRERTEFTNFNKVSGTYWTTGYQPPPVTEPWILNSYDYKEAADSFALDQTEARAEFDFDPATGFLRATRTLATGKTRSAKDVLLVLEPGPLGEVLSETAYGGDIQALDTGSGWTVPTTWHRKVQHTYQYGVRKTSEIIKPAGTPFGLKSYDVDLDASTGKVTVSRDPAGFVTSFVYDAMGRLLEAVPQAGGKAVATMTPATSTTPAKYRLTTKSNNGATVLADSEQYLDEFGRTWKERRWMPDLGWVERETLYDAGGRRASVSAWGDLTKKTQYLEYDPFGRPGRIRPPEGAQHDQILTYKGDREVTLKVSIATSASAETLVSSVKRYDAFGKLRTVHEKPFSDNTWMGAGYRYNVSGKLVSIWRGDPTTGTHQSRRLIYDNRGFLLHEKHPEKGANGNGFVYYRDYDALGMAGRMLDGPNDLGYVYDDLGRILRINDRNQGSRPLKEFVYDGAPGYGAGKLWKAKRHNYLTLPWNGTETDYWVEDTYSYGAMVGKLSQVTTRFQRGPFQYTQQIGYNAMGQVFSHTYPQCDSGFACPQTPAPAKTIQYNYNRGYLRSVTGWTNNITYHPSGSRSALPRANNVTDRTDVDTTSPGRLARFYTQGAQPMNWDSGLLQFDGAGNIKAAGSEVYVYDKINRLVSGTVNGETQTYTYDSFTNLTDVTHTGGSGPSNSRSISVVPSTNRLSMATYDAAGNMTGWGSNTYTYDPFNSLVQINGGERTYLYNAADHRVAVIDNTVAPRKEAYSVRNPTGKVLRIFGFTGSNIPENREWIQDYVYAGGALVAVDSAENGVRHYHRDHLGSLRLVTDSAAQVVGSHAYFPYGDEQTDPGQNGETTKYTGHERDENGPGTLDDLDYMMARFYSPHLARFLSCDPKRGRASVPISLNRYAYAWGSPTLYVDPSGMDICYENVTTVVTDEDGNQVTTVVSRRPYHCGDENIDICSDPLYRAYPECTGQDSIEEINELLGDPEQDVFERQGINLGAADGWLETLGNFAANRTAVNRARCVAVLSSVPRGPSELKHEHTIFLFNDGSVSPIYWDSRNPRDLPNNLSYSEWLQVAAKIHGHTDPAHYYPSGADVSITFGSGVFMVFEDFISLWQRGGGEQDVFLFPWALIGSPEPSQSDCYAETVIDWGGN